MKTQNLIVLVIILVLLVFSGCRDVKVKTVIHRDGSFTRIITVTGEDSSEVAHKNLPFPVDDSWKMEFSKDSVDSTKFIMTYTKHFRNSKELKEEIDADTSFYKNFKREVSIRKRFGFFYSYLTFREVYQSINPFRFLDAKDFLSEEDLQWYSGLKVPETASDSALVDSLDSRVDNYLIESVAREFESILEDGVKKLNDVKLNNINIRVYHDSLLTWIKNWDLNDSDTLIDLYSRWTGNPAFNRLHEIIAPQLKELNNKTKLLETWSNFENYTETVELPGLLTGTNSPMLNGNTTSWDVQPNSFLLTDFEMYAESRVINYWAFVVAGVVVLLLLVLLVVKAVRR